MRSAINKVADPGPDSDEERASTWVKLEQNEHADHPSLSISFRIKTRIMICKLEQKMVLGTGLLLSADAETWLRILLHLPDVPNMILNHAGPVC